MDENRKNADFAINGSSDTETVSVPLGDETVELSGKDAYKTEALSNVDSEPEIRHYATEEKTKASDGINKKGKRQLKYLQHVIDETTVEDDPTYKRFRK